MSVGFVGGGPAWIIEAVGGERSALWQGYDRIGDQNHPQQKIWLNTYVLSGESQPQTYSAASLDDAARALNEALVEIAALASEIAAGGTSTFDAARLNLSADAPDSGYHADIGDYADFSKQQRQILGAVTTGWVFGGMGSWNDVGSDGRPDEYERTSEQLFRALIDAICAVANASYAA